MLTRLTKVVIVPSLIALSGCASKLDDVVDPNSPTMKTVYENFTDIDKEKFAQRQTILLQRSTDSPDQQLGSPPYPERLAHLYPRLPNPDLFMYVRPHAIGISGAPVPAYITRFSMYERQPYAMPGETLDAPNPTDNIPEEKSGSIKSERSPSDHNSAQELFHE